MRMTTVTQETNSDREVLLVAMSLEEHLFGFLD